MDLASLDIYDDRLTIKGEWISQVIDQAKEINFALCTSELKLIENVPVTLEEIEAIQMFLTFEENEFVYDENLFDMMK